MRGVALSVVLLLLCQGFDWPGRAERLVNTLTSATTPRDRRDALRLLRELAEREGVPEGLDLSAVEAASQNVDPDVRAEAWSLLAVARRNPDRLELALRDVSPVVRLAALQALRRLAPAHEALVRAVTDPDPNLRAAAVGTLAQRDDTRSVSLLASALHDVSIEVRVAAVRALGQRREPEALTLVEDSADDPLPELRAAALDTFVLLPAQAGDKEPRTADARLRAEESRSSTPPSALATCQRALDDSDEAVLLAGLRCLLRGAASATPSPTETAPDPRLSALARSLSPIVASAATHLIATQRPVDSDSLSVRDPEWLSLLEQTAGPALSSRQAAQLVAQLEAFVPAGETLAADPLLAWLPRAPASLHLRLARLIERTQAGLSATAVLALLVDAAPRERAAYVRLLAQSSSAESDARLLALLDVPDSAVRAAAVFASARALRGDALPALVDRLDEASGARRRDTLWVLAALLERLQRAGHPPDVRVERALVRQLRRDLTRNDDPSAALALSALGSLRSDDARAEVRAAVTDVRPGRSIAALRASTLDRTDEARRARQRMIVHPNPRVAATAMVALALAGDRLAVASAVTWLRNAAWPRGPAASFALAHAALRNDAALAGVDVCAWPSSDEPITRHNLIVARLRRFSPACRDDDRIVARGPRGHAFFASRSAHEPAALRLEDSTVIVSIPDASGRVDWPSLTVVEEVSAFLSPDDAL
ncbi:MAG: hypothetical protein RLZZ450_2604 [Pseudomonadota bacterium]